MVTYRFQAYFNWPIINSVWATPITINVDSNATFLHTVRDNEATNTIPIDLNTLGITAGEYIRLEQLGDARLSSNPGFQDDYTRMLGVFSSRSNISISSDAHRVTGAIDAGVDFFSHYTWFNEELTDIAEDFLIDDINILVPLAAQYLFVSVADQYFSDNSDPDGDFAVRISSIPVPEPSSFAIFGLAIMGLSLRKLKR